jgi:hypothetical protein
MRHFFSLRIGYAKNRANSLVIVTLAMSGVALGACGSTTGATIAAAPDTTSSTEPADNADRDQPIEDSAPAAASDVVKSIEASREAARGAVAGAECPPPVGTKELPEWANDPARAPESIPFVKISDDDSTCVVVGWMLASEFFGVPSKPGESVSTWVYDETGHPIGTTDTDFSELVASVLASD